jgi:hypothetical protein
MLMISSLVSPLPNNDILALPQLMDGLHCCIFIFEPCAAQNSANIKQPAPKSRVTGKDAELIDEVCTGKTRSVML